MVPVPVAMTRPWKHPKTGGYWLRKRVSEAKQLLIQALSELEDRWQIFAGASQVERRRSS
jgi:hypothetical protein